MSKQPLRFAENLLRLPEAFSRGYTTDHHALLSRLENASGTKFAVIGSGASYSSALFLGKFLARYFHIVGCPQTPYEYYVGPEACDAAILISARGRNIDILAAAEIALARRARPLVVVTGEPDSPLVERLADYPDVVTLFVEFARPDEREGFFGVQSVVAVIGAFLAMIPGLRARVGTPDAWCATLSDEAAKSAAEFCRTQNVHRPHVVGLGSGWGLAPLHDLESKFVEGGLGWFEISETKNFSHGRYVNSVRRSDDTVLFIMSTTDDEAIADVFDRSLASMFPIYRIKANGPGALGAFDLFVRTFHIFNALAEARGVDVSRPNVPASARYLFKATELYPMLDAEKASGRYTHAAVAAKREILLATEPEAIVRELVPHSVVRAAVARLASTRFGALVCDYDGTLVSEDRPSEGPPAELQGQLVRLLDQDVPVALISARGKSLVREVSEVFGTRRSLIYCYLYNGGVFWPLGEDTPRWVKRFEELPLVCRLIKSEDLSYIREVEEASLGCQVTLHLEDSCWREPAALAAATSSLTSMLTREGLTVQVKITGRNIVIFPASNSKVTALRDFSATVLGDADAPVLVVGDHGEPTGNDYELLQEPFSVSVDRLHWVPHTCFPVFSPQGRQLTGPSATLHLLSNLTITPGEFSIGSSLFY